MFVRRGMRGYGRLLTYDVRQAKRFTHAWAANEYRNNMDDRELWSVREIDR